MSDKQSLACSSKHLTITPSVLYFGTPVVLVTTRNLDGSANITPISSAWALGDKVVLGLGNLGQGAQNLRREGGCVLNFPSAALWQQVEGIARATGCNPVPETKRKTGYEYVADKFALGGFTAICSDVVGPPHIAECPLQFEAQVVAFHGDPDVSPPTGFSIIETQVLRVHAHCDIVVPGTSHVDTAQWKPLFYTFRHYFGPGPDLGKTFKAEI